MSLDIMFELGLLISAAGGPGESMTSQNFTSAAHFFFDVYIRIISNLHLIYYKTFNMAFVDKRVTYQD